MSHLFFSFIKRATFTVDVNFGTFRGMVRLLLGELGYLSGALEQYTSIRPKQIRRLVFVCLGNINRSAFAAEVAKAHKARAISLGLSTTSGASAFEKAILMASTVGIDLSSHRATDFSEYSYEVGDLLLAMEVRHMQDLIRRGIPARSIALLGHWGTPRRIHIHDPHVLSDEYFQTCFLILHSATQRLIAELREGGAPCIES